MKTGEWFRQGWEGCRRLFRFLYNLLSGDALTFLLFLLLSTLFWFIQRNQATDEVTLAIPIHYRELPADVTITSQLPQSVQVTIRDRGNHLYAYQRHRRQMALNIDLMAWHDRSGIGRISMKPFEARLQTQLEPGAQILRFSPDSLIVYYVNKESKTLPVELKTDLQFAPQRMMSGQATIRPAEVTAFAPAAILDQLSAAQTKLLSVKNLKDTLVTTLAIQAVDGVQFQPDQVEVLLPVVAFTEGSVSVPVEAIGLPDGYRLRTFPQNVQVSFLVSEALYLTLSAADFQAAVDYGQIQQSPNELQPVQLLRWPEGVRRLQIRPEKVDCLIEKK